MEQLNLGLLPPLNQIKFVVRQTHQENEKKQTQSSITKVNPNDVTAPITVTFKIH